MDLSMKQRQTHRHGEELGGCQGGGSGKEGLGGWGSQMPTVMYEMDRDFPGCPVVKNLPSNTGDVGLIPGQGT